METSPHPDNVSIMQATKLDNFSPLKHNVMQNSIKKNMQVVATGEDYLVQQGKYLVHYILNPRELRDEHPLWHYAYLVVLVFAAFLALFIGPVAFGMLAAFGGIGAPFILSIVGGTLGVFAGILLGVVFAVVCIVALIKAVGIVAEWTLQALWVGANDLLDIARHWATLLVHSEQTHQD